MGVTEERPLRRKIAGWGGRSGITGGAIPGRPFMLKGRSVQQSRGVSIGRYRGRDGIPAATRGRRRNHTLARRIAADTRLAITRKAATTTAPAFGVALGH